MKVLKTILVTLGIAACMPGQAQTFTGASAPEVAYPTSASGIVIEPDHVSNYGFHYAQGSYSGNLYAYSWSRSDNMYGHSGSISTLFMDASNTTVYAQHTILVENAFDIEVGTIDAMGARFVIASYYNADGVFLNIYKYDMFGGLFPHIMKHKLSDSGKFPRIDSHKGYANVVTWMESGGIMVAAIDGGLNISNSVLIDNTDKGVIPDVAFGHEPDLNVRIAYYRPNDAEIHVISRPFFDIFGPLTISFTLEDVKPNVKARYIDLDCPDHFSYTRWAYVYDNTGNQIIARSYSSDISGIPFDFPITDPSLGALPCRKPSIAYSDDNSIFNVAWSIDPAGSPNHHILGVMRDVTGGYITPFANYLLVANNTQYGKHAYVALSKSNEHTGDLFSVYSMHPINDEMRYKFKNYGSSTYRGVDIANNILADIYPNPFEDGFQLNIEGVTADDAVELQMIDVTGRTILSLKNDINTINLALSQVGNNLTPGMYMIQLSVNGKNTIQKVIKN